jgi:glycosyltransferase involved in cell wall biosynthesis
MLVPYPNVQGPLPKHVPLLVDALRRCGCDVETEFWSRHADHETLTQKIVGRAGDVRRVRAHLRRRRFDVMYVTSAHNWPGLARDIPLMLATRRLCPRRVIKFHGSHSDWLGAPGRLLFKAASRWLVGACDATLVLSRQEKREWAAFYPPGRFEVVSNAFVSEVAGVASSPEAPDQVAADRAAATAGPDRAPTLLFVGRLIPEKGILDLVEAVARTGSEAPCELLVAGDGPAAGEIPALASRLGIPSRVRMLGYVSGSALADCYREADVLVLPTYWAEGFPTVLLEAMSMGVPIVTTALRGAADWLQDGVNAVFVAPRRPAELAAAIERILADERLRADMETANRAVVRQFAPDAVAPRYLAILKDVAGAHAPRRASAGS